MTATSLANCPRPGLLSKLTDARTRKLTLVQAPAGFGKTTLLRQWRTSAEREGMSVAWVTFTGAEWTPDRWLQMVSKSIAPTRQFSLEQGRRSDALLARLNAAGAPALIILDEYENCDTREIGALVSCVLAGLPAGVHIAIACRHRPCLEFAKLYAIGEATLIGAAELQLSLEDAQALLKSTLSLDRIKQLHQLSEGWAIVLQLSRLWLDSGGDPDSVLEAVTDQRQEIAMFLDEQIVSTLSAEQRDLLIDSSFLEGIAPDLVDHVRDRQDSLRNLHALSSLYPLLRPEKAGSSTVCLHPVLRAHLQHLLAQRGGVHAQQLNRRAAEWYANARDVLRAVRHAVKSDEPNLAAQLFERSGGVSLMASGHSVLDQALAELSEPDQCRRPKIMLARLIRESLSKSALESHGRLEQLKAEIANFSNDPDLQPDAMIAEAWFQALLDEAPSLELLQKLSAAVADEGSIDLRIRVLASAYLEMCSLQRGDPARVELDGEALSALCREHNFPYQLCYSLIYRGICAQMVGDYARAAALADEAADFAEKSLGPARDQPLLSAQALKAEVLFDMGALEEANAIARSTIAVVEGQVTCFDVYAPLLRVTFGLTLLGSGTTEALTAMRRVAEKARPVASKRLRNLLLAYENSAPSILETAACDVGALANVWRELERTSEYATWREIDAVGLAYARALIVTEGYAAATAILDELQAIASQRKWRRTLIEIQVLRASIHLKDLDPQKAAGALKQAISLAQPCGIRSPFLSGAEVVAHVLSLPLGEAPASFKFAKDILKMHEEIAGPYRLPLLTRAEHSVLIELMQGSANKVIARRLNVTENTVKTHLKNIFKKASVQSREEAIEFAKRYLV